MVAPGDNEIPINQSNPGSSELLTGGRDSLMLDPSTEEGCPFFCRESETCLWAQIHY